jgi:hypothetical protein
MKAILVFALFSIIFSVSAQESDKYLKYKENENYSEGYIVDFQGNGTHGVIHCRKGNGSIVFVSLAGEKKILYPSDIQRFDLQGTKFVSDGNSFYEVIQEGKGVSLYKKTVVSMTVSINSAAPNPGFNENEVTYLKKTNDKVFSEVNKLNFKKKFSEYFGDCEQLKSKIESKELRYKDIEEIIYIYL